MRLQQGEEGVNDAVSLVVPRVPPVKTAMDGAQNEFQQHMHQKTARTSGKCNGSLQLTARKRNSCSLSMNDGICEIDTATDYPWS